MTTGQAANYTPPIRKMYLNERHLSILALIGMGLSQKIISARLEKSTQTIGSGIMVLVRRGYVARRGRKRSLRFMLTDHGAAALKLGMMMDHPTVNSTKVQPVHAQIPAILHNPHDLEPAKIMAPPINKTIPKVVRTAQSVAVTVGGIIVSGAVGFGAGYDLGFKDGRSYEIERQKQEKEKSERKPKPGIDYIS